MTTSLRRTMERMETTRHEYGVTTDLYLHLRSERPDWTPLEAARVAAYWPRVSPDHADTPTDPIAEAVVERLRISNTSA